MSSHVFLTGYYGFGNTGDEAILASIVADLRLQRPDLRITVASNKPEETAALYSVESLRCTDAAGMIEAVRTADLVAIGGGGIFHDYWGFNPHTILSHKQWGISYFSAPALLAALHGKPLMLYAVGVGPLLSENGRKFTRLACEIAQIVTVRDEHSQHLLESLGVRPDKVRVTADPAFALPLPAVDFAGRVPLETLRSRGGPVIGVAPRHWDIGVHPTFWEPEVAKGLDLFLKRQGGSVVFLPFQSLSGSQENDDAVIERIRSNMKEQAAVTVVNHQLLTPQERFTLLGQCDAVLSMRLHAAVAALMQGTPLVALNYDPKVEQLMTRVHLDRFLLNIRDVDAHELAERLQEALSRRAEIGEITSHAREQLTHLAHENTRIAVQLLDSQTSPTPLIHPDLAAVLLRPLTAQVTTSQELEAESQRLMSEFTYYLELSRKLQKQVEAAASQTGELTSSLDQARQQAARRESEWEAELGRVRQQASARETELASSLEQGQAERESLRRQVDQAESNRTKLLEGLDRFQMTFSRDLEVYRAQRAWQVMLAVRKAYGLLMERGLGSFLKWALKIPFSGFTGLGEQDLRFPDVWKYVPEDTHLPIKHQAASFAADPEARGFDFVPAHHGRYDVIILPVFDFEFRFQRPQQIAAQYARSGHRVFWLSPVRPVAASSPKNYETVLLRESLWEIRVRSEPQQLYEGELTHEKTRLLTGYLREVFRDFAISESCVILQFPYWRRLGLAMRESFGTRVIYDCMDDWEEWKTEPLINEFNLSEERSLATESDVVMATARALADKLASRGARPILVPNAADFPFFSAPRPNPLLSEVPKPIVGYYGAIANWLDLDLMYEVARSRPQYSFVLVGCVYSEKAERMRELPNVHFTGERTYREMPLFLWWFDVCVIPFCLDELTQAVDPVKMYEYLSQGKPVVATDMKELAPAADLLYLCKGATEFAAKLDLAIAEPADSPLRQRRIDFAATNTWKARVEAIDAAVAATFPLVSVLIVTYNSLEFLAPCFDSIRRNTSYPSYELVVVDNHSTDGTRERLEKLAAEDSRIRLTCLDHNAGFAGGNNLAARQARGEYLIFLNPDTMVTPGWIGRLVDHCQKDPSIGLLAAVTNFAGNEVKIDVDYRNSVEMEQFALKRAREQMGIVIKVPMAPLFCVLTPRAVWEKAGELDEGFQVGMFEDDDFSLRVRGAGFQVAAAEDCFIHHFGNGSFAKLPTEDSMRIFEKNRQRFEAKWRTKWVEHKLRPGVRNPLTEEPRFSPARFVQEDTGNFEEKMPPLMLRQLHPVRTQAGQHFSLQPNGQSALAAQCENARPTTIIMFDNAPLATNYGGPRLLTAWVPPQMYSKPGRYMVHLVNDFGESNRLEFVVEE